MSNTAEEAAQKYFYCKKETLRCNVQMLPQGGINPFAFKHNCKVFSCCLAPKSFSSSFYLALPTENVIYEGVNKNA